MRRFIPFAAALLATCALAAPAGADVPGGPDQPETQACALLAKAGVTSMIPGANWVDLGPRCDYGKCLTEYKDGDQAKCDLAHSATLILDTLPSVRQARRPMNKFARACARVRVGADVAYQCTKTSGSTVVMAKGKKVAIFMMGAGSDQHNDPAWNVRSQVRGGARKIAKGL